jgi:hypothetical protein
MGLTTADEEIYGWLRKFHSKTPLLLAVNKCESTTKVGLSLPGGVGLATCATRTRLMGCTHSRGVSDWLHVRPELDLWVALTPGGCQIGHMPRHAPSLSFTSDEVIEGRFSETPFAVPALQSCPAGLVRTLRLRTGAGFIFLGCLR